MTGLWKSRAGNIPITVALLALPMTLMLGGALDFMRHEKARSALQNGLDRGVLAATSLSQTMPARETIGGYVKTLGISSYTLTVDEAKALNSSVITAEIAYEMPTTFLSMIGVETLDVVARARAEEKRERIEISLVLDLSGSMRGARISAMVPAAKSFITRLVRPETKDYTSMSLVPYAGQVSVGKAAFDALATGGTGRKHDKSSCFGNLDTTFSTTIPDFTTAEHVPQFSTWLVNDWKNANKGYTPGFDAWNCPTEETSVTFLSNDPDYLTHQIDGYHMFDGTATHIAMKWGLHLLDPAFKPSLKKMAGNGGPTVVSKFDDRPSPFNDGETLKVIVLMTDGEIVAQQRPKSGLPVNDQPTVGGTNQEKVSGGKAMDLMSAACLAAKNKGVLIYAIGFDVQTASASFLTKLRGCASSPSHYYDAKTSDLNAIFQNIAGAIERVHLVGY